MKFMIVVFLAMAAYGTWVSDYTVSLFCVAIAIYTYDSHKHLARKRVQALKDPRNAEKPKTTSDLLNTEDCECMSQYSDPRSRSGK